MWPLLASLAFAQDDLPELNAQLWRPSIDARDTMWADDARRQKSLTPIVRLYGGYVARPLSFEYSDNGETTRIVSDLVHTDLTAGLPIGPVRIGAHLPVYLLSTTQSDHAGGAGLGDVAFDLKASFLDNESPAGFAASARLLIPTNTVDLPLGLPGPAVEVGVITDVDIGPGLIAINLGYRLEPTTTIGELETGDPLYFRLGAGVELSDSAGVSLDVGGQGARGTGVPVEGMLGGWFRAGNVVIRAAGGRGFTTGVGSSGGRALLSVGWESNAPPDSDKDGIVNADDPCPKEAEDVDGFKDDDGCPDLDDDVDGVPDVVDTCPRVPEDLDDVQDDDGCPEPEVKVTVALRDLGGADVTGVAAIFDGGTPITGGKTVVTGLLAGVHTLQLAGSGYDPLTTTFEVHADTPVRLDETLYPAGSTGGMDLRVTAATGPEPDGAWWSWSGDTRRRPYVPGTTWTLPEGTWDVVVGGPGYRSVPFQLPVVLGAATSVDVVLAWQRVTVGVDRLVLTTPIEFSGVDPTDGDLLDEVAEVLWDHPQFRVRVVVHTDKVGSATTNKRTSQRRAEAVRDHLVKWGIDADRVEVLGLGEDMLLDPADSPEAHARNRRVEILIVD